MTGNNNVGNTNNANNPAANTTSPPQNGRPPLPPTLREQDQYLPISNIIRIMRSILPAHAKISDEAKETLQQCVSEFISFVTEEANDRCQKQHRKTITADDLIEAMCRLGFDDFVGPLFRYLHRYRESQRETYSDPITRSRSIALAAPTIMVRPPSMMDLDPVYYYHPYIQGNNNSNNNIAANVKDDGGSESDDKLMNIINSIDFDVGGSSNNDDKGMLGFESFDFPAVDGSAPGNSQDIATLTNNGNGTVDHIDG
ncbi:nuclear transcription factor Y subunit B-9-like [Amaranthus tricolor]|uniref:nuclear transcription factor Y subunit B-9-like n=1 Tax=Amaranthus tricolor TaxID=29722 RepID=UPI00258D5CB8|nr:nuclear transcription factor Y subunit B-9-like [Amaranthus tricolor]